MERTCHTLDIQLIQNTTFNSRQKVHDLFVVIWLSTCNAVLTTDLFVVIWLSTCNAVLTTALFVVIWLSTCNAVLTTALFVVIWLSTCNAVLTTDLFVVIWLSTCNAVLTTHIGFNGRIVVRLNLKRGLFHQVTYEWQLSIKAEGNPCLGYWGHHSLQTN